MITKILYQGDNGKAKFWESEDGEILLNRNYDENYWILFIKGLVKTEKSERYNRGNVIGDTSLTRLIKITRKYGYNCLCSLDKRYVLPYDDVGRMGLEKM